jgi:hypothetical protein
MTWMTATRRKVRGVLGLGVIGAAIGFVAGPIGDILLRLAFMALQGVPDVPNLWSPILSGAVSAAVDWSLLGAFTGIGFGTMLALTDGRRTLDQLPQWRMGLFGGIAGALFLGAYVLVQGEWRLALGPSFFAAVGVASALGAGLTTSIVALAKRARRQEMAAIENLRALSEPE